TPAAPPARRQLRVAEEPAIAAARAAVTAAEAPAPTPAPHHTPSVVVVMFPLFLAFWFLCAFVTFSWAGEKMPWLNTHIALPGNLLIAWGLSRIADVRLKIEDSEARSQSSGFNFQSSIWLVPFAFTLLLVALGVALWRFGGASADQQGQAGLLQGLVPLAVAGALLYAILTIAQRAGAKLVLGVCALTLAALAGAYTTRATWLVVYDHPDTPRDPLVYVQSSPDVPLIVREIRELAVNQTRNARNPGDPIGGLTMPLIMDNGDAQADGEGSLAWPYQWYLRDFQRLEVRDAEFFRQATPDSFLVNGPRPGEDQIIAPVVMVSRQHVTDSAREALEANYVRRYEAKLNWWFPEGNKCDPESDGYKKFYFAYPGSERDALKVCPGIDTTKIPPMLAPLLWPLDRSHWDGTGQFLLYRAIPEPLRLDGREMQVWVRKDLAPTGEADTGAASAGPVKLVAQQAIGEPGALPGQIDQPRGVAVDDKGNIYVADTGNHRITIYAPDGQPIRTIGGFGSGPGQFNEPRGVAVDDKGNIYVADTWNARIVKLDPQGNFLTSWGTGTEDFGAGRRATVTDGTRAGNDANPLGFFGPRGVAVDDKGNVYVADTGNKRIVVTDTEGNFRYQWGSAGSQAGSFNEPIGVAVDAAGNVYVGDTWNGRVQVFPPTAEGPVSPLPTATWRVPGWQPQTYDDPYLAVVGDRVVVSVPARNTVIYYDALGQELLRFGGTGQDMASLNLPSGLAGRPQGEVYVVDRGNARVLRFVLPALGPPRREGGV
ncbi:MAG TPA: SBBP repeat-containing protein, partial [Roseiflexaceae bacterium]|nr:SBBP repeat-containing protein [Roseiflexaceae bacterium]